MSKTKAIKSIKNQPAKRVKNKSGKTSLDGKLKWIICGVLAIITFIAFAPVLKNNFINWDDNIYLLDNLVFKKPVRECVKYFFSNFVNINYHPLTMIVYMLEYQSAKLTPELYHELNLIIHILNVMMVFWFIYLLSGKKIEVATIVALFFGVHPMHVESVAWISELKDVLYTFFFVGGLICYYKYITEKERKNIFYFMTLMLFVISGLSKPAAVTFTLVLPLMDYYLKRKNNLKIWLEKIPFIIVSIVFGILTVKAQSESAIGGFEVSSILKKIDFVFYGMMSYIEKLFLPINLSLLYPYPKGGLMIGYYIAPFLALILFYFIYKSLKFTRMVLFGFLFFFVNIILVLQFVSVGHAIIAERYTYVPYIGLLFIIGMGFSWIYRNKNPKIASYKSIVLIGVAGFSITSIYLTNARCQTWFNSELVWSDVINQFPNDYEAYQNRGNYLARKTKYDINPSLNEYDRALDDFNMGLSMKPNDSKLYSDRAYIYNIKQKFDLAIKDYSHAIKMDPNNFDTYLNRGITYSAMLKYDNAILDYNVAEKIHGGEPLIYQNRGCAYFSVGKYIESSEDFTKFIEMNGQINLDIYYLRAIDYLNLNKLEASLNDINKVIEMKPDYGKGNAYFNRSMIYNGMKKFQAAIDDALKAQSFGFEVDPNYISDIKKQL